MQLEDVPEEARVELLFRDKELIEGTAGGKEVRFAGRMGSHRGPAKGTWGGVSVNVNWRIGDNSQADSPVPAIITGHFGEDAVKLKGAFRLPPNYLFEEADISGRAQSSLARAPGSRQRVRRRGRRARRCGTTLAGVRRPGDSPPRSRPSTRPAKMSKGSSASQESEAARWWLMADRGHAAGRTVQRFAVGLAGYREVLDGEKSHTPKHGRGSAPPAPSVAPVYLQPSVGRDFGPDL